MAWRRYERDNELGPKQQRAFLLMFAIAGVAGLVAGIIWVVAGLLHLR